MTRVGVHRFKTSVTLMLTTATIAGTVASATFEVGVARAIGVTATNSSPHAGVRLLGAMTSPAGASTKSHLLQAHTSSPPVYTPNELYGGVNPTAVCYTCVAPTVTGSAPRSSSLDGGTGVNSLTGDFSTSNTLFNAPAIGSRLGETLTYDAQLAQAERAASGSPNPFGWGWSTNFSASITPSGGGGSGQMTVNMGNGAQLTFNQSANGGTSGSCPSGDNPNTSSYTVPNVHYYSNHQWCALANVQGQVGDIASNSMIYAQQGGVKIDLFYWNGSLEEASDAPALWGTGGSAGVTAYYNVAPGTAPNSSSFPSLQLCPTTALQCTIYESSDGRDIVNVLNSAGQVTQVIDPSGVTYNLTFDSHSNLAQVTKYANQAAPSPWTYVYSPSQPSPYTSDMVQIYDPDSGVGSSPPASPGASHSTYVAYNTTGANVGMVSATEDGTGATTAYAYTNACAAGQCLAASAPQQTTITYPAEVPCPNCSASPPVEVDTYSSGVETSTSLGTNASQYLKEKWQYSWTLGQGSGNSTETITYPHSLSGTAATAQITLDPFSNVISTTDVMGNVATSAFNDASSNFPELLWSYPGSSGNPPSNPPAHSEVYTYNNYGQVTTATNPDGRQTGYAYYSNGLLCAVGPPTAGLSGYACQSPYNPVNTGDTVFVYDGQGDLTSRTIDYGDMSPGAGPLVTTASYNTMGDKLWSIPATGQAGAQNSSNLFATVITYTPANLPLTVKQPGKGTSTVTYDAMLNPVSVALPIPSTYLNSVYDADNRLCFTVTSASRYGYYCSSAAQAGSTAYTYMSGSTNLTSVTDANGQSTSYYYGDLAYPNSPTEVIDPMASATQYRAYDDFGNACVVGDVAVTLGLATQCNTHAGDTTTVYNALNDETSVTDPSGITTTYAYTDARFPTLVTSSTNALGATTSYAYDGEGRLGIKYNPDLTDAYYTYDADGRLTVKDTGYYSTTYHQYLQAAQTTYTYNGDFERTGATPLYCNTGSCGTVLPSASYAYANGQLTSATDENGKTTNYLYNYAGQVMCIGYPVSATTNCGTITSPATGSTTNTIVKHTYDAYGRLTGVTDWLGNTTTYGFTKSWLPFTPSTVTYPLSTGLSTTVGYDNAGNVTSVSAGSSINDTWTYDNNHRVNTTTMNGATSSSVVYNANNQITAAANLASSTNNDVYTVAANGTITADVTPTGATTSFGYNAGGELCWSADVASASSSCSTAPSYPLVETNFAYTANGQRSNATTTTTQPPSGTISPVGSLVQAFNAAYVLFTSQHVGDALVLSVGIRSPTLAVSSISGGGSTWQRLTGVSNNPDVELWLGTVNTPVYSAITVTFTGTMNVANELAVQEYSSGLGANSSWEIDHTNSVNSTTSSTNVALPSMTATGSNELYVGYGMVSNAGVAGSTSGFTYDVTSTNNLYVYNTSLTGTGAPTATQSPTGTYVAVAALLRATTATAAVTNYGWDPAGQMCNVSYGSATNCLFDQGGSYVTPWEAMLPTNGTSYQYDGDGLRIGAESSVTVGSTKTTSTTYSTWDPVTNGSAPLNINDATTTSSNPGVTTNNSYIYGNLLFGGNAPVEQITGTTATFLVANPTGVQGVYSSTGAVLEQALYSVYGVQTITSGTSVTPFGFQGSYTDSTGLIYLINRYYDPTTDQFMSVDPLVAQTNQPYVFTNDSPLNATDPLGLTNYFVMADSGDWKGHALPVKGGSGSTPVGLPVVSVVETTTFAVPGGTVTLSVDATVYGANSNSGIKFDQYGDVTVSENKSSVTFSPTTGLSGSIGIPGVSGFYINMDGAFSYSSYQSVVVGNDLVIFTATATYHPGFSGPPGSFSWLETLAKPLLTVTRWVESTCEGPAWEICVAGGQ
jgi:RHS repeat-associated protein